MEIENPWLLDKESIKKYKKQSELNWNISTAEIGQSLPYILKVRVIFDKS